MNNHVFDILGNSSLQVFVGSLVLLLTIMNPLGMLAIFMGVTANYTKSERKKISIKTSMAIAVILIAVTWLGTGILSFFSVSIPAFEVAGGLLLFMGCLPMVRPQAQEPIDEDEESNLNEDISIVPLAFPIVGGPAAILQVLICLQIYGNNFQSKLALTFASVAAVTVLFLFFYFGEIFMKIIGINGLRIIKILIGIILLSIAVNIVAKGVVSLVHFGV